MNIIHKYIINDDKELEQLILKYKNKNTDFTITNIKDLCKFIKQIRPEGV